MRKWLRNWLFKEDAGIALLNYPTENSAVSVPETPHVRIGVLPVMNGKVLEICTFKRNNHGPDWQTTYWILSEELTLAEQIATVLAMKGLEK
jgi:hypothetical protein